MASHCHPCPAGTGPWHGGFSLRPRCYEELAVQPELAPFRTNEDNQEFPFREIAAHQVPSHRCDLSLWKLALLAARRLRQWHSFDLFQPTPGSRSLTCEKSINQNIRMCHADHWFFQEYFSQSLNYFQQQEVIMKTKCIYEVKSLTMD